MNGIQPNADKGNIFLINTDSGQPRNDHKGGEDNRYKSQKHLRRRLRRRLFSHVIFL